MVHFAIVPINRQPDMGFWVKADTPEEARRLISLNVPGMEQATSTAFARCDEDQTYVPAYGVIVEGTGRTFTVKRR